MIHWLYSINPWFWLLCPVAVPMFVFSVKAETPVWLRAVRILTAFCLCYIVLNFPLYLNYLESQNRGYFPLTLFWGWIPIIIYIGWCEIIWRRYHRRWKKDISKDCKYDFASAAAIMFSKILVGSLFVLVGLNIIMWIGLRIVEDSLFLGQIKSWCS